MVEGINLNSVIELALECIQKCLARRLERHS
jgi:hypothetical protein